MTRWYRKKKKEHFYKKAKKEGYRARSAFKLKQIQKKFKVIKKGDYVLDLGAAPGGWSQVALEETGEEGKVIGVDLSYIKPLNDVTFIREDITEEDTLEKIRNEGVEEVDVIISDMSPDITGNYSMDQARSVYLCLKAVEIADSLLKKDGCFVCKVFEGEDIDQILKEVQDRFSRVNRFHPSASRKSSSEVYIIAKGYAGKD
ncbi:MAG: RlmE family RNA methyltransferase [Candidatus Thermoplasmatota archaeon]